MRQRRADRALWLVAAWLGGAAGISLEARRKTPIKVACVGASITEGFLSSWGHDYPAEMRRMLGTGYEVQNFGIKGKTAMKSGQMKVFFGPFGMTKDAYYGRTSQFESALAFLPDIVILQFGSNDSKDINWQGHAQDFVPDYSDLARTFQNLSSKPTVYIMVPPPLYLDHVYDMNLKVINTELPDKLRRVAELNGLAPPIDVFGAFLEHCPHPGTAPCDWIIDGCHPSDDGYHKIAEVVMARIAANATAGA
uniref:SGNH hydrolase-type esterase domain-containing protein n=1 Tax=Alexandrium catenella TaxID=2925 RepID=A0A7S1PPQ7_ALECA|mmetsp:Transcript_107849/g.287139  ORF Transcript_107849/g.287139 Transcript_107849/m.287139 type:complete len:251 (+) Transcript_107849:56-808(+)